MSIPLPQQIAVLGPGLIGGSLLMALRQRLPGARLSAWVRRTEAAEQIVAMGLAQAAHTDLAQAAHGAELIVLCTPVETMKDLAQQLLSCPVSAGCIVTDAGSVKASVVYPLEQLFANSAIQFVGSHPMAGSERAGIEAARPDLFDGATCILTPTARTSDETCQTVRAIWALLGCRVIEMSPEAHDRKVARISHLPRLVASALTMAALRDDPTAADCIGNGFRDTAIRVASGDPGLWTGIISQNRCEVLAAVRDVSERIHDLVAILENVDDKGLRRFLDEAKTLRDTLA
ncbi:MAG: prephenate dehydrogenase [Roseimicrobium sp.]